MCKHPPIAEICAVDICRDEQHIFITFSHSERKLLVQNRMMTRAMRSKGCSLERCKFQKRRSNCFFFDFSTILPVCGEEVLVSFITQSTQSSRGLNEFICVKQRAEIALGIITIHCVLAAFTANYGFNWKKSEIIDVKWISLKCHTKRFIGS